MTVFLCSTREVSVDVINIGQTDGQPRAYSINSRPHYNVDRPWRKGWLSGERPKLCRFERNQDYVSKNVERWKELAARCLGEQDPAKLTELAKEMNLILAQKQPRLNPPLHAAGSHEEGQRDVLKPNPEGKACFT